MSNLQIFFLGCLAAMNTIGFVLMGIDKLKAKTDKRRIPESTLFIVSIVGGSLGSWIGMYVFHHKTKHWYFVVGMPLILILQLSLFVYLQFIR